MWIPFNDDEYPKSLQRCCVSRSINSDDTFSREKKCGCSFSHKVPWAQQKAMPKHVVLSQYKEDISWVYDLPRDVKVWLYQSHSPSLHNIINGSIHFKYTRNVGREGAKYLKAMIDFYDDPPPEILFLQAHEVSHHQCDTAQEIITTWPWGSVRDISWVDADWSINIPDIVFDERKRFLSRGEHILSKSLKERLFKGSYANHEGTMCMNCCAQFSISRDALHKHPKRVYRLLYNWISREIGRSARQITKMSQAKANVMERWWGSLFQLKNVQDWIKGHHPTADLPKNASHTTHSKLCADAERHFIKFCYKIKSRADGRQLQKACSRAHKLFEAGCHHISWDPKLELAIKTDLTGR
ncbi:hypothetical protein RI054_16g76400 [Pseudoscourfieldia marina]